MSGFPRHALCNLLGWRQAELRGLLAAAQIAPRVGPNAERWVEERLDDARADLEMIERLHDAAHQERPT